jgi:polyisoprenoid-binding protein YceI
MVARSALGIILLASAAIAQPRHYDLKPSPASKIELRVTKTGLYRGKVHVFLFPRFDGSLSYDAQKPEASQVRFRLDAASIQCTDTWLSPKDLRSVQEYAVKDMLDAAHHPDITFTSSTIKPNPAGGFDVSGSLKIRDIEKPSVVNVKLEAKPDGTLVLHGEARIKLTDYKLKPPTAALGTIGTKDEMDFSFDLIAAS